MPISPIAATLVLLVVAGCCLAFWKGGPAERTGAGVILANLVLLWVADLVWPTASSGVFGLVVDGLTAVGLLMMVLRYASLWLGGVMLLYALKFTLHAFYFVTARAPDVLHAVINNVDFMGVVFCLVAGTAVAWRKRSRAAASDLSPTAAPAP
jgi:hypothetical protein